jgi:hypothetical protein
MQALERLESAAFCICLDDDAAPVSRAECANHFWHGTSSHGNNRWMDKSIQLIVTANGKAGLVGEHSMYASCHGSMLLPCRLVSIDRGGFSLLSFVSNHT